MITNNAVFFRRIFPCITTRPRLLISQCQCRYFSLDRNNMASRHTFTELKIPTEYGFLAAKEWGPSDGKPVLAVHGWQDNAGSFDPLIPWLKPSLHVVAMELPGHGYSSHKPPGAYYHFMEYLVDMKRVINFMKWNKTTLLGHSMGGSLSLLYSSIFQDDIESVVSLDILKPLSWTPEVIAQRTATAIRQHISMEEQIKKPQPVYSEEDALKRMIAGQNGSLTEASAKIMLRRGSKISGGGYIFTRDIRLQVDSIQRSDSRLIEEYISHLRCNLMIIVARKGFNFESAETLAHYKELYTKNCKKFRVVEVEGTHHAHMNNPEVIGPLINAFLDNSQL